MLLAGYVNYAVLANSVADQEVLRVTAKPLHQLVFQPVKKVPAQVVSLQSSLLTAEISALVSHVHVKIGDKVTQDQVLVTLECDDYQLNKQLLIAEKKSLDADYDFAYYQYQRSKKLLKTKSVSQESHRRQATEITRLSAHKQLLNIKIKQADKAISRCTIKAPFTGVIAKRLVNIGENVAPRSPLMRLTDIDNLEVEVQVPIVLIDNLNYSSLNFIYRKQAFPLAIRAIIPAIETRSRHQRVRLSFSTEKTLPDAYGMVEITLQQQKIPASYLVQRGDKSGVFILKKTDNTHLIAHFHVLDNALPGRAAIINLHLESQIIIAGRHALNDGQSVMVAQ